jgi:hypothetical protein
MEADMEELHKTHKDVPFGWVLFLQELVEKRRARKPATAPSSDLRHLAAPR